MLINFLQLTGSALTALAQKKDYVPLTKDLPKGLSTTVNNAPAFISALFVTIILVVTLLAVVWIVLGGIQYMSTDAYSGKSAGKTKIRNALLGLLLAGTSWIILNTINPNLLNINLDFSNQTSSTQQVGGQNTDNDTGGGTTSSPQPGPFDGINRTPGLPSDGSWSADVTVYKDGEVFRVETVYGEDALDCLGNALTAEDFYKRVGGSRYTASVQAGHCTTSTSGGNPVPNYNGSVSLKSEEDIENQENLITAEIVIYEEDPDDPFRKNAVETMTIYGEGIIDCNQQRSAVLDYYNFNQDVPEGFSASQVRGC